MDALIGTIIGAVIGAVISIIVTQVNETMRFLREARREKENRKRAQLESLAEAEANLFETLSTSQRIRAWSPTADERVRVFLAQRNLGVAANELFDEKLREEVEGMMAAFQRAMDATGPDQFNEQMTRLWDKSEAVRGRVKELRKELG